MTRFAVLLVLLATLAVASGCALWRSEPTPARARGGVVVDAARGMTLYTFDRDVADAGRSACTATCLREWLPFAAPANARRLKDYEPIVRDDGTRQWTYKGKPLYFSARDANPGDRRGDGAENLWRVARP